MTQYLRGVDDDEVGGDGGQEQADGQEGGQGVEEIVEVVLTPSTSAKLRLTHPVPGVSF